MNEDQTWQEQIAELPIVMVDQKPEILVMQKEDEVIAWVVALPSGDAWIIKPDARGIVHSGSLKTLTEFWSTVYDAQVGLAELTF